MLDVTQVNRPQQRAIKECQTGNSDNTNTDINS